MASGSAGPGTRCWTRRRRCPSTCGWGEDFDTLVVTGPNTGGKTVTLKTAGLLTVMAQCGLHIPVGDAIFSVFSQVLADIGDEQSIEQSPVHLLRPHDQYRQDSEGDRRPPLVLYDELGRAPTPLRAPPWPEAIIEESRSLGSKVCATTHYAELKLYAMTTDGVENACCEFDVESLRPTYRLLIGCRASPTPSPSPGGWGCPTTSSSGPTPICPRRTSGLRTSSPSWRPSARSWRRSGWRPPGSARAPRKRRRCGPGLPPEAPGGAGPGLKDARAEAEAIVREAWR